jgi:hypothetical protein
MSRTPLNSWRWIHELSHAAHALQATQFDPASTDRLSLVVSITILIAEVPQAPTNILLNNGNAIVEILEDTTNPFIGLLTAEDVNVNNLFVFSLNSVLGPSFPFTLDPGNNCKLNLIFFVECCGERGLEGNIFF